MLIQSTDQETLEIIRKNPKVVIMFYANWCGSCRLFKPKFEKISNKNEFNEIVFLCLNAEECPELRKKSMVNALPFFATYNNGILIETTATLREEHTINLVNNLVNAK